MRQKILKKSGHPNTRYLGILVKLKRLVELDHNDHILKKFLKNL
jgi:hypothetical protein